MAYPANITRPIVFKAQRDTLMLVAGAMAATFALSSVIHSHPVQHGALTRQGWTGDLADIASVQTPPASDRLMTSASLVVPAYEFALPQVPVRALVRLRGCGGSICLPKANVPTPVPRPFAQMSEADTPLRAPSRAGTVTHDEKANLMSRLNPLSHLPDMTKISRPFTVAGDTVTGWFRRF